MSENQYVKRDISWLSFNHRVLQEAKDISVPLYERIKFLAIYSSNLDEFFRVRVASLRSFKELKKKTRKKLLDVKPKKELKEIQQIVDIQQKEFGQIFRNEILPNLKQNGISVITDQEFNEDHQAFAKQYYLEKIAPLIQSSFLNPDQEQPFLKEKGLYFIITFNTPNQPLAIVNIPSGELGRFLVLPKERDQHFITFLDEIIRYNLPTIFKGLEISGAYAVKVSRDAELYINDEYSGDLIEKIRESLDKRNVGLPTRFLYDTSMPDPILEQVKEIFDLTKSDLVPGARYHNFSDFFAFPDPTNNPDLHDKKMSPQKHPILEQYTRVMDALKERDIMLHFPYQSYGYVPKLIREAADDDQVETIKITLYRVAAKSKVTQALMYALKKGKTLTVFIEAKARFDEQSNLYWGGQLQKAGANVLYSYPGIKVHTKLLLISTKTEPKYYTYLGTGNFNEKTAKLYCDHALLTTNPKLGKEVGQVFEILERKIIIPKNKHLFIAPFNLRKNFVRLIDKEILFAKAGKEAYLILKMNSLEDPGMIDKLYEASNAGVSIKMIVRGICCLVPGIKGRSENIEVISIVDRFLEHARIYIFGNGGEELMFTASADWMTRNLDRRIEVAIPIYDKAVYKELRKIINIQFQDNIKARHINPLQTNPYVLPSDNDQPIRAQDKIYSFLS